VWTRTGQHLKHVRRDYKKSVRSRERREDGPTSSRSCQFSELEHRYWGQLFTQLAVIVRMNPKCEGTSEGFTMTEFPAARAGAIFFIAMKRGWLKGCHHR